MTQPPQGGYPPPPQQPYPQPPGQYPPQAYPPQYPLGAPYPFKRGPNKGLGVLKVLIGLCATGGFGFGLLGAGHEGIAVGAILGLLLGGSIYLLVSGGANLVGKKIPLVAAAAIVGVFAIIGAAGGPPMSGAFWEATEKSTYDKLISNNSGYPSKWEWDSEYFDKIPEKYQRPEARGQQKLAEVIADIKGSNLVGLRTHIRTILTEHQGDPHYAPALDAAAGELKKRYDEVLAKLGKPGAAAEGAEYPVDENLRSAFKDVLTDLSRAPEADIHVAFQNSSVLEAPEGHEYGLRAQANYVKNNMKLPVMDPPKVIDQGAAFSPAYDKARRGAFITAAGGAFNQVFDANLLSLKPLEDGDKRDGKFVLEVSSKIRRTPSYFYYTSGSGAATTLIGFAFAIEVDWELKLFGRDGKLLYEKKVTSEPGEELFINTQTTDPDWAIYSILMDSAYYNYSREVVGNFGVPPPEKKTSFTYSNYGITGG